MFQVTACLCMSMLVSARRNWNQPHSAEVWAKEAKGGFSTNYFKTPDSLALYNSQNCKHIYQAGFRNVRLRSNATMHNVSDPVKFDNFLNDLEKVVDDCLKAGVFPIIS